MVKFDWLKYCFHAYFYLDHRGELLKSDIKIHLPISSEQ